MLVLGRKVNERLIIDGNIVVTVVRASNGTVRLGIDAPAHISIKREELLESPTATHHGRILAASPV
jgi:carbon storage regulator